MEGFNYNEYKNRTRRAESGGNDSAKNPNSSASGRFQFTEDTWKRYGYNWKDRFNPQLQEEAMQRFTNDNVNYFKKNFKKEPSYADAYGMHFLGATGYKQVYTSDDNTPIHNVVSQDAYTSNKSVFSKYNTVGKFKEWLKSKTGQATSAYEFKQQEDSSNGQPTKNYLPNDITMQEKRADEFVDLSFAEKAEEAKKQIQEYQVAEDLINQMPIAQQEQPIIEQPQQQIPTYDYLFNQNLFTLQFQDGGVYGKRNDGSNKDIGFLGELLTTDNNIMTENSIGVEIDGQEMEIPTVVPTLTKEETDWLLQGNNVLDRSKTAETIIQKAIEHAQKRLSEGKSPFYTKNN